MTKEEFFAVGGTENHLKNPEFNVMEFITNFSMEDELEVEFIQTSQLIDDSYLIYPGFENNEATPSLYEIDMEYGCQHKYDSGYEDGYYEAMKKYGFYLTSQVSILDYEWEKLLRNLNKVRYQLTSKDEDFLNELVNKF